MSGEHCLTRCGLLADRPAAGDTHMMWFVTDTGTQRWTYCDGASWADVAPGLNAGSIPTAYVPAPTNGMLSAVWPVGSVFTSVVATNPATLLGFGTWAAFGAGRVLVGLDAGDPAFDTAEETGGAKTIAAAGTNSGGAVSAHSGAAVADHASHTHTYTQVPNHVHIQNINTATTGGAVGYPALADSSTSGSTATGVSTANPTGGVATGTTAGPGATLTHAVTQPADHSFTQPTFTGSATSVVQPYIVVFMWKRTA